MTACAEILVSPPYQWHSNSSLWDRMSSMIQAQVHHQKQKVYESPTHQVARDQIPPWVAQ